MSGKLLSGGERVRSLRRSTSSCPSTDVVELLKLEQSAGFFITNYTAGLHFFKSPCYNYNRIHCTPMQHFTAQYVAMDVFTASGTTACASRT